MDFSDDMDFMWDKVKKESKINQEIMATFDDYGITRFIYEFVASQSDMFKILMKIHPEVTMCGLIGSCLTALLRDDKIILKKKGKLDGK